MVMEATSDDWKDVHWLLEAEGFDRWGNCPSLMNTPPARSRATRIARPVADPRGLPATNWVGPHWAMMVAI